MRDYSCEAYFQGMLLFHTFNLKWVLLLSYLCYLVTNLFHLMIGFLSTLCLPSVKNLHRPGDFSCHPKVEQSRRKEGKEMGGGCAPISQEMRIKLAQSVHRSTIGEDEKYFLDHVQSFIIGGKRRNEWGGKKVQTVREKECALAFYLKGHRFLCAQGHERTGSCCKHTQSCCSKMRITRPVSFHFSINDCRIHCIFVLKKRIERTKFNYREYIVLTYL